MTQNVFSNQFNKVTVPVILISFILHVCVVVISRILVHLFLVLNLILWLSLFWIYYYLSNLRISSNRSCTQHSLSHFFLYVIAFVFISIIKFLWFKYHKLWMKIIWDQKFRFIVVLQFSFCVWERGNGRETDGVFLGRGGGGGGGNAMTQRVMLLCWKSIFLFKNKRYFDYISETYYYYFECFTICTYLCYLFFNSKIHTIDHSCKCYCFIRYQTT